MHTERPLCALPRSCRLRPAAFRSTPHRTAQSPLYTPLLWYAIFYATFVPPRPTLLRSALQEGAEVGEGGAEGVDKEGRRVSTRLGGGCRQGGAEGVDKVGPRVLPPPEGGNCTARPVRPTRPPGPPALLPGPARPPARLLVCVPARLPACLPARPPARACARASCILTAAMWRLPLLRSGGGRLCAPSRVKRPGTTPLEAASAALASAPA